MECCSLKSTATGIRPTRRARFLTLAAVILLLAPVAPRLDVGVGYLYAQDPEPQEPEGKVIHEGNGITCRQMNDRYWYQLCAEVTITCTGEGFKVTIVIDRACWPFGERYWKGIARDLGLPIEDQ